MSEVTFLRGATEAFFLLRSAGERAFAHVPSAAVSDVARPCGLDGSLRTRRAQGPVLVRSKTCEALERERYMRPALIVNAITYPSGRSVHQDLHPALPTAFAVEGATHHGRSGTDGDSDTAPRAAPRAR